MKFPDKVRIACAFIFLLIFLVSLPVFSQNHPDNLIIESEPAKAQVFIDAVLKGTTPLLIPRLPAGEHMLVIYKEGYENYLTTLTQTEGTIHVELKKHKGSLKVTTTPPDANIYLDGKYKGIAPITINYIDIGRHKLKVEKAEYKEKEEIVEIAYQVTKEIDVKLSSIAASSTTVPGSILVISEPPDAQIYLDGELKGDSTPFSLLKISSGVHELELIKDGYQIYHANVAISSGKSSTVSVTLVRDIYWPMFRHDPRHSGYINTDFSSNLTLIWKFQTEAEINSGITVVGDSVFVASQDRFLYCLNISNGAVKWKYEGGEIFSSSPAVVDGTVFVGNDDDYIHAVDAKTGQVKWKYLTGGDVSSSPIIIDNVVYVGSFDRFLYAINSLNGSVIWKYAVDREIWSSPVFFNQVIYVGSIDGFIYALDAKTGTLRWKYKAGGAIKSSPVIQGNSLYVGSDDGYLYALDARQGTVKWQFLTDGAVKSSPAVKGKFLVFGSDDNNVYCVNKDTEKLIWKLETMSDVSSSPAVTNELVVIGSWDRKIYVLDINTGKVLWTHVTGGSVASSAAIIGKRMFVGSRDGSIYAFEEK